MKIPKSIQADLALIAITFVWGSTFTIVKSSLAHVSPILFLAIRFWIATAIILACMPRQMFTISGKVLRRGILLSLFLLGGFVFQTLGLRDTSPSYSAFITSLSVLLVPLLGYLFFRNRPRLQTLAGIGLATAGLYLLLMHMKDLNISSGDGLTLVCAILFAFQILFLGAFVATSDYRQLMFLQVAGTAVFCSIMAPFLESPFVIWNWRLILYLLITGVLATALAFYVQARAQQFTTSNRAALIFSLEPFFAALFAYWILGQVLTVREWMGGGLILTGILVSELRLSSRKE
ncbi:MAG: DMT family transporter [Acidobacteria bacterium]|nr:DMT family transporter [Acidobacteriota bacterium]